MGTLREMETGRECVLEPDHLVGRSARSGLFLDERRVSGQQASIRWTGNAWEIKDLGSRNGTFVNGERLQSGQEYRLSHGAIVSFGIPEKKWQLVDDAPPVVMIVPLDGGAAVLCENGLIAVPSIDDPQVTVFRAGEGTWLLENDRGTTPVQNQQVVEVANRLWRFCAPEQVWKTSVSEPSPRDVRFASLVFRVSRDEEDVRVQVSFGAETIDLPPRSYHYFLLTLARRRLQDAQQSLPEPECGWIDQEDLAHDQSMAGSKLHIDVFRIRRQFADIGMHDAAQIIERRPRGKQLRIGTARNSIVRS